MKTKLTSLFDALQTSFWFVPALMAAAAVVLSVITVSFDQATDFRDLKAAQWIYAGGPEGARMLLSTIAGSMITVAGVTFSITIVALALTSSQFGPRLLRNKIDLAAALALPGVVAPMSGNELPEFVKPMPGRGQETAAKNPRIQWPSPNCLAKDKVRFVGEAVAVLVTSDPRTSRRTRWS